MNFSSRRLWIATVSGLIVAALAVSALTARTRDPHDPPLTGISTLSELANVSPLNRYDRDLVLVEQEGAVYRFDDTSTATADGVTVVAPSSGSGRWYVELARVTGHEPSVVAATVLNPTGLGTPTYGQRWLIAGSGAGGWASQDNKIAQYVSGTKTLAASWRFIAPGVGSLVTSTTTGKTYQKASGGTWVGLDFATAIAANAMLTPATAGTGATLTLAEPTGGGASYLDFVAPALTANHHVTFGDDDYALSTIKTGATAGSAAKVKTDEMLTVAVNATGGTLTLQEPTGGGASKLTIAAPALTGDHTMTFGDDDYAMTTIKSGATAGTAAKVVTDEMLAVAGGAGGTLKLLEPTGGGTSYADIVAPALTANHHITFGDDDYDLATIKTGATAGSAALPKAGGQITGNITCAAAETFDGRDVSADGGQLDTVYAMRVQKATKQVTITAGIGASPAVVDFAAALPAGAYPLYGTVLVTTKATLGAGGTTLTVSIGGNGAMGEPAAATIMAALSIESAQGYPDGTTLRMSNGTFNGWVSAKTPSLTFTYDGAAPTAGNVTATVWYFVAP